MRNGFFMFNDYLAAPKIPATTNSLSLPENLFFGCIPATKLNLRKFSKENPERLESCGG